MTNNKLADALRKLLDYVDALTCRHEQTHRGGSTWTICDDCDMKWADSGGGFVPYSEPAIMAAARLALAEHDAPDKCFCDRMYPDSNPNTSCGDCPTQDYAQKPTPASAQADKQESEMSESRFYIEHGVVHDRKTGKHLVGCYYTDEDPDRLLSVLRELETDYDAWRMPAAPAADGAGELPPIERDEAYERDYIPLPGGWGIQTKGKGSTFRVCDTKTGERAAIPDERLHPFIERMAREVRAAIAALRQPVPDAVREEVVGAIAKPATGWDVAGNYGDGKWRAFRLEKQQTYLGDPKSSEMEAIAETHRLAALASQQESRNDDDMLIDSITDDEASGHE